MGRNLLLPYAIIAVLGVFIMIAISFVGANQRDAIENPEEAGDNAVVLEPEDIYKNNCASCHGGDLTDGSAPALNDVGSRLSEDEIKGVIMDGRPDKGMPGGLVGAEEASSLAEWLAGME